MTREAYKKHKEAIEWFYAQPEGTKIWCKKAKTDWFLVSCPTWDEENTYVINDKYAELRKAIADGKIIQYFSDGWYDLYRDYNGYFVGDITRYKIKPETKFPIYKKNDFMVIEFLKENEFIIEFIFNIDKFEEWGSEHFMLSPDIGSPITFHEEEKERILGNNLQDVLYDGERKLWDGQPVWAWRDTWEVSRSLEFYDVKNRAVFGADCKRNKNITYDNYEPYLYLTDEWIIEQYNKLDFES